MAAAEADSTPDPVLLGDPGRQSATRPTVSVLMPVFNGAEYLAESIDSILKQTLSDFELVAVDDGSTDDSWKILSSAARQDERILLLRHAENRGLVAALNTGLGHVRGEFVARHDQDDEALAERLATQVAFLKAHPEVGVVGSAYYRRRPGSDPPALRTPPLSHTALRWRLLFGNVWCHASVMIRRSAFPEGQFRYHDILNAEDYDLWSRLLEHSRGATIQRPLTLYREHSTSISARHGEQMNEVSSCVAARQISRLTGERPPSAAEVEALRACHAGSMAADEAIQTGQHMLQMFALFSRQRDVDPTVVRKLRRRWLRRLLLRRPVREWSFLWRGGLLPSLLREDGAGALYTFVAALARRMGRRLRLRSR